MPDIRFSQGAENGIANGVHQHISIRMAIQTFGMRDLDSTENEFSAIYQRVDIVSDPYVNHPGTIRRGSEGTKSFVIVNSF